MTVELVKEQIKEFVESDEPQVLVIKGSWGVGKTHIWNSYIKEFKESIPLKKYSYVSLFGINSVNDIKRTIFENSIDVNIIGKSNDLDTLKNNYKELGKQYGRKSSSIIKDLTGVAANFAVKGLGSSVDKAYESIATAMLSKTIICFDDIERHSKSVSLRDFLGLVSFLKEQKKCKVIILLNEDSHDLKEYQLYKEKVIDKQLHYEPSAEHCFNIAISQGSIQQYQHIKDVCLRLDIRNIRVLKKIYSHIEAALRDMNSYDTKIQNQIVQTIIILCWSYYCHGADEKNIPDLKFIKKMTNKRTDSDVFDLLDDEFLASEKEDLDKNHIEKRWKNTLDSYNYESGNPLSVVLISSVERGFVDKEKLKIICDRDQSDIEIKKSEEKYNEGWNVFHSSFDSNVDEVIQAMNEGLRSAVKNLSSSQYSDGIKLIRELGDEDLAEELSDFYIDQNKSNLERLNLNSLDMHPFGIRDPKFKSKIQNYYDLNQTEDNPNEILQRRSGQNSYDSSEVKVLEKLSVEELKVLFKNFKGEELTHKIRACLMLAGSSDLLMTNTKQALTEIGNESILNKFRLSKFNVN